MAWRSSGSSHEDMINCLKRNGLISAESIEKGFLAVDRRLFVPAGSKDIAYTDQPLREGKIHISAPHIYCSALEALQLEENTPTSFLNIGSGTGYLSCIAAEILGPQSLNYGIEIYETTVKHSQESIEIWKSFRKTQSTSVQDLQLEIIHGNIFNISSTKGESMVGFDRIYVGAAVSRSRLAKITKLLSPGGILVGPVDDELVKVIRIGALSNEVPSSSITGYNGRRYPNPNFIGQEFTQQVLTNVRFAPLVHSPHIETLIPARVWSPKTQKYFPETFKKATDQIFLCSNSMVIQPLPPPKKTDDRINFAAMLPKVLWMEVFSFTHRKWFESEESEISITKKRLIDEQKNASKAHIAQFEAERRCLEAEKERDVYRLLARRWQSRLNLVLQQQRQIYLARTRNSSRSNETSSSSRGSIEDTEMTALFGRDTIINMEMGENDDILFFSENDSFDEEDEEHEENENDQEDDGEISSVNSDLQMEDHFEREDEHDFESDDDVSQHEADRDSNNNDNSSLNMDDIDESLNVDMSIRSPFKSNRTMMIEVRSHDQIRSVSMGSEDL